MTARPVGVGIVGGGLMGRESAAAIGRWTALEDHPVRPEAGRGVRHEPGGVVLVRSRGQRPPAHERLRRPACRRWRGGPVSRRPAPSPRGPLPRRDPGGQGLPGREAVRDRPRCGHADRRGTPVPSPTCSCAARARCRSTPAPSWRSRRSARAASGEVIGVESDFLHSSDLDRRKPINWKRQARYCGEIGVMGDLGMHVAHVPLRLGMRPGHRVRPAPGHSHRAPRA